MLFTIAIKVSKHFAMFLNKLMENLALKIFLRTSSVVLRCFCIFYYRFNPITLLDTNRRNGKFIYKIVKTAHFSTHFYLELSQNCCAAPTLRCLFFQTGICGFSLKNLRCPKAGQAEYSRPDSIRGRRGATDFAGFGHRLPARAGIGRGGRCG